LKESKATNDKLIKNFSMEINELKQKRDSETALLTEQLEDFKANNNLDEYFSKYLTDETRKNTLRLVKELVTDIDTDDSMDKLREYKDSLEKFVYSDAEGKLQNFYNDLMKAQTGHLEIYARQTAQAEEDLKESLGKPPIPCHVFD